MLQKLGENHRFEAATEVLRRTRLFADIPAAAIEQLARCSFFRFHADGECIVSYGEPGVGIVIVASGCIVTSRTKANGKRLIFDLGQPGQVMGTFAAFDGQGSPLDNHARGETRVLIVPYEEFRRAVRAYPDLAIGLIATHSRRNRVDFERLMTMLDTIRVRVAKVLLYMIRGLQPENGEADIPVHIAQDDIAGLLGISRPSVNKALVALVREGIVDWHYGHVIVKNIPALIAIVAEDQVLSPDIEHAIFARSRAHYRTAD